MNRAEEKTVVIGTVGAGYAASLHGNGYKKVSGVNVRLKTVCDLNTELAKKIQDAYGYEQICSDYHDMLADPEIDVIDIVLPPFLHTRVAKEAIEAGKHVICEKPLTGYFGERGQENIGKTVPKSEMYKACVKEMDELRRRRFDSMFHREFFLLGRRLAVTGSAWLKTQSVIFLMTSSLSMLGLLLIGNPYYILGGIGIGVLDALPIFGTGTALVPWSILLLFKREWGHALILFGLYLLCYFLREFTEAHLMGKKMGLSPLETLAAIYVGLQLFGLFGFLLGPIGLLIIKDFVEEYGDEDEGTVVYR